MSLVTQLHPLFFCWFLPLPVTFCCKYLIFNRIWVTVKVTVNPGCRHP